MADIPKPTPTSVNIPALYAVAVTIGVVGAVMLFFWPSSGTYMRPIRRI